jgi:hypothetical protein
MRLLHRPLLFALTAASLGAACDKKPETPSAPAPAVEAAAPATPTPAPAPAAAPTEPGPAVEPALTAPAPGEVLTIATYGDGRKVTSDQVEALVAPLRGQDSLTFPVLAETVEDVIDDSLLADEARAAGFDTAGLDGDKAIAEAWAKKTFLDKGRAAVTDADLTSWFSERRGVARIWVRTADQAAELRKNLMDSFKNAPDKRQELFLELKRKVGGRPDPAPDGVLVDVEGKGELGEALVPAEIARAAFALKEDFEVSEPVAVNDGFALVQRVAARPATPLAQVPKTEVDAAREKLAIKRANLFIEEHAARLRVEKQVVIDEAALARLGLKLGLGHGSHKKIPLGVRKIQLERLRNSVKGVQMMRDPNLVPTDVPPAAKAKYEEIREKMNRKPARNESGANP